MATNTNPQPSKKNRKPKEVIPDGLDMRGIRQCATGYKIERMYKGHRGNGTAKTLAEALVKRQEIDAELRAQALNPLPVKVREPSKPSPARDSVMLAQSWTLRQAIDVTFRRYWRGTADANKQKIRAGHLTDYFGESCPIAEINTDSILGFREWAEDTLGNGENTINKKVCCLSKILRTAFEHEKLDKLPKIPLAKVDNSRLRFMTPEEEEKTLEAFRLLTSEDHVEAFIVLIDTGFRLGELWTITAAHINPLQGTVSLWNGETKNGWGRTVHMTSRVSSILMKRRERFPTGPLWPGRKNNWFQHQWNKVRTHLGKDMDPEWVTHMLRHTCCSRLVQAGVDLFLVQRWMGHKSLSITQRYAHHGADHLKVAGAALENLVKASHAEAATG